MNVRQIQRLLKILSLPTAPFRENHVAAHARLVLERNGIPHFSDPVGNLVVGCESAVAYRKLMRQNRKDPVRLFIAHMDHPGFHGVRWLSPQRLLVKWHGGSPVSKISGSPVWLADEHGMAGTGRIERARLAPSRLALSEAEVRVNIKFPELFSASQLFGGFHFRSSAWRSRNLLFARAADDLVGVFAILEIAMAVFREKKRGSPPFLGLLTRGEEVGFVGAIAHFELGWQQDRRRPCLAISLETSRALPGALIGHGPVIRLGDRRTIFNPDYVQLLTTIAEHVLPGKHQRRVMDGGSCDATAATAWGLPAIGISVPLGNYHNEEFARPTSRNVTVPKTRGRPAPEYVHTRDVDGLLRLCKALMQPDLAWGDPWHVQRQRLRRNFRDYRALLKRSLD